MANETDDLRRLIEQGFAQVLDRLDKVEARLGGVEDRLDKVEARLEKVEARLTGMELAQAEMRGELRGLSSWLASMDQRFIAIMRPYEPPHRPA